MIGSLRTPAGNSRRLHRRVTVALRVTPYGLGPTSWCSWCLSEGGIAVKGAPVLSQGTQVGMGIWLPTKTGSLEIPAVGEVVWAHEPTDQWSSYDAGSMGFKFIGLEPRNQGLVRRYVTAVNEHTQRSMQHKRTPASNGNWGTTPPCSPPGSPSEGAAASRPPAIPNSRRSPPPSNHCQERPRAAAPPRIAPDVSADEILPLGTVLGAYRLRSVLGFGGMGAVYLAEHIKLGRKVALKRLHSQFCHDNDMAQRFFAEARVVNQIRHDNLVEITDFVADPEHTYFVMELLDGVDLGRLQKRRGALAIDKVLRIAIQLCDVLNVVHGAKVIHRDLKPENIVLIRRDGRDDFVKLLDFGIAKLWAPMEGAPSTKTATGIMLGTPGYMAPEHLLGKPIDHRYDVYALGLIMYQMVTGERPFVADSFGETMVKQATEEPPSPSERTSVQLPDGFEEVIVQCLAKEPVDRPASMKEIGDRLRDIEMRVRWPTPLIGQAQRATSRRCAVRIESAPGLETYRGRSSRKRSSTRRVLFWLGLVAAVAGLLLFWLGTSMSHQDSPPQRGLQAQADDDTRSQLHQAAPTPAQ